MRWALVSNNFVVNVIEQDTQPQVSGVWIQCGPACPGWTYDGTTFAAPAPPPLPPQPFKAWAPFDYYRRFTSAERIAIRSLAATDPVAQDFIHTLDSAIAAAAPVKSNDPDLINGLGYLSTHPSGAPALTVARAAELLT